MKTEKTKEKTHKLIFCKKNSHTTGKLLPGVKAIIANPDTKGHCGDSHLGEIWVQSPHTANGYFTIYGDEKDYNDHFNAKLATGATTKSTTEVYARTGYLGFLRRTECSQASSILDEVNKKYDIFVIHEDL